MAEPRGVTKSRSQSREHCECIIIKTVPTKQKPIIISLALFELSKSISPDRGESQAMSANHGGGVGDMSPELGSDEEKRV